MAMDPKQERALRDGTASEADLPRDTSREAIRAQEENPSVGAPPRTGRRTAAVAEVGVNLKSGTPVERVARQLGAEPLPELGRARRAHAGNGKNGGEDGKNPDRGSNMSEGRRPEAQVAPKHQKDAAESASVPSGEARRTMKARREHSKGDGNFPGVEPGPELLDERPEDRQPRDTPKARDDRGAPKGNVTAGQRDRNPDLAVRDEAEPQRRHPRSGFEMAERAAETPKARAPRSRPTAEATNASTAASRVRPKRGEVRGAQPAIPKRGEARGAQPAARKRVGTATARRGATAKRRGAAKRATAKGAIAKRGSGTRPRKKTTSPRSRARTVSARTRVRTASAGKRAK
jgi:hypothetical protein